MAQGLYDIRALEALIEEGFTLLTPNHRLARRIKTEWDAQCCAAGAKVWQPLAVQPLEQWLLEQWNLAASTGKVPPLTPLAHTQILELWRQVISDQEQQSADYHLLRTDAIAEMADQARELLLRWQVDTKAPQIQQLFHLERDCSTFLQWLHMFEHRLAKAQQCTPADCLIQLAKFGHQIPMSRVALVEFDQIAPLLRTALTALSPQWQEVVPVDQSGERVVHAFASKRDELKALATWVVKQRQTAPTATIGVVLSNMSSDRAALEYLLRREFDCLGEDYTSLPVNFSTGVALIQTPLVRDALAALSAGLADITVPALVDLLHSRFLVSADMQSAVTQRFIKALYAQGHETIAITAVCDLANGLSGQGSKGFVLARQLRAIAQMPAVRRPAMPSTWAEHFNTLLSLWGWPGEQVLDSLEYQQLELWGRTLDEFAALDAVCKPTGYAHALTLLRDCCARQVFQPQTTDSPIQVLGPLEAAGLSFDHLWVCGMQATSWPSAPCPNPLVPMAVQIQFEMPHANSARELAFSTALLERYARTSQTLHASFCRQLDGVPEMPSALLAEFVPQAILVPAPIASQWVALHQQAQLEAVDDQHAPPLVTDDASLLTGGSSLLEDQSQCPFRAFARHRLKVRPLPNFYTALSAGDRGSLLHAALSALWVQLADSATLIALDTAEEQQVVYAAIDIAVASLRAKKQFRLGGAFWSLEREYLAVLLHEWLAVERRRSPFIVVESERELVLELAPLHIRLQVDRVDQLPDGSRVVVDYKSGESRVRDWLGERPARPQLPLYALAESGTAAALAFAQVRPRHCGYAGLGRVSAAQGISTDIPLIEKSGLLEQDWSSLNANWRRVLEGLATEFASGRASVDPHTPASCTGCGLQALCRIDAAAAAVEEQVG